MGSSIGADMNAPAASALSSAISKDANVLMLAAAMLLLYYMANDRHITWIEDRYNQTNALLIQCIKEGDIGSDARDQVTADFILEQAAIKNILENMHEQLLKMNDPADDADPHPHPNAPPTPRSKADNDTEFAAND